MKDSVQKTIIKVLLSLVLILIVIATIKPKEPLKYREEKISVNPMRPCPLKEFYSELQFKNQNWSNNDMIRKEMSKSLSHEFTNFVNTKKPIITLQLLHVSKISNEKCRIQLGYGSTLSEGDSTVHVDFFVDVPYSEATNLIQGNYYDVGLQSAKFLKHSEIDAPMYWTFLPDVDKERDDFYYGRTDTYHMDISLGCYRVTINSIEKHG